MESNTTYITATETAKLVRKQLKASFPEFKFSVKTSKYAGGSSINVAWTDGPAAPSVDEVIGHYCGASFDGMTDCKNHHNTLIDGEPGGMPVEVHFGNDFIFTSRTISPEFAAVVEVCLGQVAEGERCSICPSPAIGYSEEAGLMVCKSDLYAAARNVASMF